MAGSMVQSKFATGTGVGTTVAATANQTAGNTLVIFALDITQSTTFGISDSIGNTYGAATFNVSGASNAQYACWVVSNCKGGANTVTVTSTVTTDTVAVMMAEVTGVTATSLDGSASGDQTAPGTAANSITTANGTNARTAFMLGLACYETSPANANHIVAGTGFTSTAAGNVTVQGWSGIGLGSTPTRLEWKASVAPGTNAATWTDGTNGATAGQHFLSGMVMLDEIPPVHLVQSNNGSAASATSLAIAYTSPVSAVDALIVVASSPSSNITFTISDSVNGTWGSPVYQVFGFGHSLSVFALPPPTGGGTPTVTISASASTNIFGTILEVSAITGTTDQRVTATVGSGATSSSVGPTGPLASAGEFSLSAIQLGGVSGTWAAGGSYTLITPTSGSSGQGVSYLTTPDVSAQTATFTWATANGYVGAVVTFNTIAGLAYTPYTNTAFFVSDRLTIT